MLRVARLLGKSFVAQQAESFWKQVKAATPVSETTARGTFIQYPEWPQLDAKRFDIVDIDGQAKVEIFHSELKQKLYDEIQIWTQMPHAHRGLSIYGPPGVGKSHALFAVMMRLYQQQRYRIVLHLADADNIAFRRIRVIIASSITHFISGEVPRNPLVGWRRFTWYFGLTTEEYDRWCEKYNINTLKPTFSELTGQYPLELYRAKRIFDRIIKESKSAPRTKSEDVKAQFTEQYIQEVTVYLQDKTGELITHDRQIPHFEELAAAPALFAGKRKSNQVSLRFMDRRFFFVNANNDIQALAPSFAAILVSYWLEVLGQYPTQATPILLK
eukprot:TRINITY_DN3620_c1_g3_i1.p1 TRINITY_DN3620_c1_g3~~TRINITY_DN3620_c1_g3_i1.p1  ORF type:complete len:329 (-),score=43.00 TRINITY_DN3620_c1_g3_i1:814-1800(-)